MTDFGMARNLDQEDIYARKSRVSVKKRSLVYLNVVSIFVQHKQRGEVVVTESDSCILKLQCFTDML